MRLSKDTLSVAQIRLCIVCRLRGLTLKAEKGADAFVKQISGFRKDAFDKALVRIDVAPVLQMRRCHNCTV